MGVNHPQPNAVLCLDIDGTLTDHEGKIHSRDVEILKDFPDSVQLMISTGRSLASARGVLRDYDIYPTGPFPLPGVFMNGGVAMLPGEQPVVEYHLAPDLLHDLILIGQEFPNSAFTFFSVTKVFLLNSTHFGKHVSYRDFLSAQEVSQSQIPDQIVKVMVIEEDPAIMAEIRVRTQDLQAEMGLSLPYLFEINPPGVNKGKTLKQLLPLLGMAHLPVYAAGDGENDLRLTALTEKFYAPATAYEHVREQADQVIDRRKEGLLAPILAEIS